MALLIYLTLEPGPHPRDELAELLLCGRPDTARSALRLELHHLSKLLRPGTHLTTHRDQVEISPAESFWVDALELDRQVADSRRAPDPGVVSLWRGAFLQGFSVKASAAWEDWVHVQGTKFSAHFDMLLTRLAHAHLEAGQPWDAITVTRRRLALDPLNEDAYRQLATQQSQVGLQTAALETQRLGREALRREYGVRTVFDPPTRLPSPQPEGQLSKPTPAVEVGELPLVGREALLRAMNEAWDARKYIFLSGEAGMGKSRLVAAFLARQQLDHIRVVAQPADARVPFSVQAKTVRTCLEFLGHPPLPEALRRGLSPIVTELWPEPPAPLTSPTDRLRLYDAFTHFVAFVMETRPWCCVVGENLHHYDRESHALGAYAATQGVAQGRLQRGVVTYRPDALPRAMLEQILPVVEQGAAVVLEVEPLNTVQVHEMLSQLDSGVTAGLAERIQRFTGGNPLFVLETARLLQARGGLTTTDDRDFPRSPHISEVIGQRFARLGRLAREVIRAAGVAGPEFSFRLATQILNADAWHLAAAFEELHRVGVFRGERFAHDLLEATAFDLTPPAARTVLHRRVLDALTGTSVASAVLARHALGGGRPHIAYPLLLQASQEARRLLADDEADAYAAQASALVMGLNHRQA